MLLYALTILISAFLLFQVQPMIAATILPWFGGSPAVWTTSMLFFQTALLLGYTYAHISANRLNGRQAAIVHILLIVVALVQLPIIPSEALRPDPGTAPAGRVLLVLALTVGLPYLILSSTSTLLQAWFSRVYPDRSPYRLYALSNAGSLVALLSYPFVFEPAFTRETQAIMWSVGFGVLAVLLIASLIWTIRRIGGDKPVLATAPDAEAEIDSAPAPTALRRLLWVGLSATAVLLFLAVTNQFTQDVASIPFLWVIPLSVYLLSFIITFDAPRWYVRKVFLWALLPTFAGFLTLLVYLSQITIGLQVLAYAVALFMLLMVLHGELARMKPAPQYLTSFYVLISLGGALGGLFVSLIAPLIFNEFYELHLGLLLAGALIMLALYTDVESPLYRGRKRTAAWITILEFYVLMIGVVVILVRARSNFDVLYRSRNFYGAIRIQVEEPDEPDELVRMVHGLISHGMQFTAEYRQDQITSYYSPTSGMGRLLRNYKLDEPRHIGVVGLGAGTLAAFGDADDTVRLYEINPDVVHAANTYFTYLERTPAQTSTQLGDARLVLEQEPDQGFDVLVLDAFSGDAIPTHLLTLEAFEIYLRHLKPDGVLGVNVTNRHVNLEPVLFDLTEYYGLTGVYVSDAPDLPGSEFSDWVLLSGDAEVLTVPEIMELGRPLEAGDVPLWTDNYTALFPLMYFK